MALIYTSGTLRTTSSDALNTIFSLLHLDLLGRRKAGNTTTRLAATNQWRDLGVGHSAMTLGRDATNRIVWINHILLGYLARELQLHVCGFTIYLIGKTAYRFLLMTPSLTIKWAWLWCLLSTVSVRLPL